MKEKIVLFLVLFCFIGVFLCFPQSSSDGCDEWPPSGPPPDKADDSYSFNLDGSQSTTIPTYFKLYPFIGIFKNGNVGEKKGPGKLKTQIYTRVAVTKLKEIHSRTHPGAPLERKNRAPDST